MAEQRLDEFNAQNLANSAWAFAKVDQQDEQDVGDLPVACRDANGVRYAVTIRKVYYANQGDSLLSVQQLWSRQAVNVLFADSCCWMPHAVTRRTSHACCAVSRRLWVPVGACVCLCLW